MNKASQNQDQTAAAVDDAFVLYRYRKAQKRTTRHDIQKEAEHCKYRTNSRNMQSANYLASTASGASVFR